MGPSLVVGASICSEGNDMTYYRKIPFPTALSLSLSPCLSSALGLQLAIDKIYGCHTIINNVLVHQISIGSSQFRPG